MDNRLIFLYCGMTELRGRMREGCAGGGKPGASRGGGKEEKPLTGSEAVMRSEGRVAKHPGRVPRKAAIAHAAPVP